MSNNEINEDYGTETICKDCEHMVARHVIPYDLSDIGMEDFEEDDLLDENGNIIPFVHVLCIKLNIALDHIVLSCSKFKKAGNSTSINKIPNFFIDNSIPK